LAAHKTGKTQVIDWLVEQLLRFDKQKRIVAVHHAVDIINDPDNREIQRASSMALFHLATKLLSGQDKSERCQELSMFLKAESGVGLTRFCNLASAGTVKSFDFQTTEFVKCSFESVDFRNCLFSGKTMFLSCSFDGTLGFHGCDGASSIVLKDCTFSKEAEFVISALTNMGIREETKRQFAEDALARALRKFKGPFGFDGIQYRYRMSGFKSGNPYNEKILDTLSHLGIIEKHKISNVAEGGLNIVHNKDVRREIIFFFDNGVLGKLLQAVIAEVIR
jgi:hypothetical protein